MYFLDQAFDGVFDMSGQQELTLTMENSKIFRTKILVFVSVFVFSANLFSQDQSYEEIVSGLESTTDSTPASSNTPVGGYFSLSTGTFSNKYYNLRGNRYTPELGLFVPGKLRVYAFTSLLSGTNNEYATQEFANPGLGFDLRLFNVSRIPQMDFWLNTQARMAGNGSDTSLATPADSYRVGGTFSTFGSGVRSQMGAAYEFRTNEQIIGVDYGDRSDFHVDMTFETFNGIYIGAEANWYVVMPLKIEGESQTPTVSWLTVGPRVEVGLFSGLDLNLLLLYPTETSHSAEVIEQAVADVHSPRLNEPTFSLSLEAGI